MRFSCHEPRYNESERVKMEGKTGGGGQVKGPEKYLSTEVDPQAGRLIPEGPGARHQACRMTTLLIVGDGGLRAANRRNQKSASSTPTRESCILDLSVSWRRRVGRHVRCVIRDLVYGNWFFGKRKGSANSDTACAISEATNEEQSRTASWGSVGINSCILRSESEFLQVPGASMRMQSAQCRG